MLVLRMSGKHTLSKMNAFDLVVTVALGSTLDTIILSKDVALAEGIVALGLLIVSQYAVTWSSVRSPLVSRIVKSEPKLLFYQSQFLQGQMRRSRVVESEVVAAVRQHGIASLNDVEAVTLETDGTMAVVDDVPPLSLAVLRLGQGALILVLCLAGWAPGMLRVRRQDLPLLTLLGLLLKRGASLAACAANSRPPARRPARSRSPAAPT